ncbi:hypothetical protein ACJX0J_016529, partial [Zea mays]
HEVKDTNGKKIVEKIILPIASVDELEGLHILFFIFNFIISFRLINFVECFTVVLIIIFYFMSENFEVEKEKREISDTERIRWKPLTKQNEEEIHRSEKGVVNVAIDEVVNTLLNEAAEKTSNFVCGKYTIVCILPFYM